MMGHGIQAISMASSSTSTPDGLRGPMVTQALEQS